MSIDDLIAEIKMLKSKAVKYDWLRDNGKICATSQGIGLPLYEMTGEDKYNLDKYIENKILGDTVRNLAKSREEKKNSERLHRETLEVVTREVRRYSNYVGQNFLYTTFDEMCLDSLDKIELCMALEAHYDFSIDDYEAEKLKTPDDVVGFILREVYNEG